MLNNLFRRVKKLEAKATPEMMEIHFSDGGFMNIQTKQLRNVWSQLVKGEKAPLYDQFQAKKTKGVEDNQGLIHLMEAYDRERILSVWDE